MTSYSNDDMEKAMEALNKGAKCAEVAANFGIPRATLIKRIKKLQKNPDHIFGKRGSKPVFNPTQEKYIASILLEYEQDLIGLTTADARAMAYNTANMLNIKNNFNSTQKTAGRDWMQGFVRRQSQLSLRKPEHTSAARASGFNKQAVEKFYDKLEKIIIDNKLEAENIYNCDETPKEAPR